MASTLVAWKLEKSVLYGTTFAVIFNIIIDLILIPDYGAYGATVATIAAETTLMFVLAYRVHKETGQIVLKFALAVIPLALISVVPSYYYVNSATNNILGIFVLVIIYTLVVNYSGFFNIFGIKKYLKK